MTRNEVFEATGITYDQITNRESGHSTHNYNEFSQLSELYDRVWQNRYCENGKYPKYLGIDVDEITPEWILYGVNKSTVVKNIVISELKEKNREMVKEFIKTGKVISGGD